MSFFRTNKVAPADPFANVIKSFELESHKAKDAETLAALTTKYDGMIDGIRTVHKLPADAAQVKAVRQAISNIYQKSAKALPAPKIAPQLKPAAPVDQLAAFDKAQKAFNSEHQKLRALIANLAKPMSYAARPSDEALKYIHTRFAELKDTVGFLGAMLNDQQDSADVRLRKGILDATQRYFSDDTALIANYRVQLTSFELLLTALKDKRIGNDVFATLKNVSNSPFGFEALKKAIDENLPLDGETGYINDLNRVLETLPELRTRALNLRLIELKPELSKETIEANLRAKVRAFIANPLDTSLQAYIENLKTELNGTERFREIYPLMREAERAIEIATDLRNKMLSHQMQRQLPQEIEKIDFRYIPSLKQDFEPLFKEARNIADAREKLLQHRENPENLRAAVREAEPLLANPMMRAALGQAVRAAEIASEPERAPLILREQPKKPSWKERIANFFAAIGSFFAAVARRVKNFATGLFA